MVITLKGTVLGVACDNLFEAFLLDLCPCVMTRMVIRLLMGFALCPSALPAASMQVWWQS